MSGLFRRSYSQFCEDLLIESYLGRRNNVSYIDIGCLWPDRLSNTYNFYLAGGKGLCIDPNPTIADLYREMRPHDRFINAGLSDREESLTYSMFRNPVFNTFDQERRAHVLAKKRSGTELLEERQVPVRRLADVLDEVNWWEEVPQTDLLCLDVEGLELKVLSAANLERLAPQLIVCELFGGYEQSTSSEIVEYLRGFGYSVRGYTGHDIFMMKTSKP